MQETTICMNRITYVNCNFFISNTTKVLIRKPLKCVRIQNQGDIGCALIRAMWTCIMYVIYVVHVRAPMCAHKLCIYVRARWRQKARSCNLFSSPVYMYSSRRYKMSSFSIASILGDETNILKPSQALGLQWVLPSPPPTPQQENLPWSLSLLSTSSV